MLHCFILLLSACQEASVRLSWLISCQGDTLLPMRKPSFSLFSCANFVPKISSASRLLFCRPPALIKHVIAPASPQRVELLTNRISQGIICFCMFQHLSAGSCDVTACKTATRRWNALRQRPRAILRGIAR